MKIAPVSISTLMIALNAAVPRKALRQDQSALRSSEPLWG